ALGQPLSLARTAWVAELVAELPGATRFPPSPFRPMARHVFVDAPVRAMPSLRSADLGVWWSPHCLQLARGRDLAQAVDAIVRTLAGTDATVAWYDDRWHVMSP